MGYEDKVDIKILRRVFCSQGSGVRGLGLGVRGQNLGKELVKSRKKSKLLQILIFDPCTDPLTMTHDPDH